MLCKTTLRERLPARVMELPPSAGFHLALVGALGIFVVLLFLLYRLGKQRQELKRQAMATYRQEMAEHEAIEKSVRSLLAQPSVGYVEYRISRARSLTDNGEHVAALDVWKELLREGRHSPQIWHGLADALAGSGEVDRARQCRLRAEFIENPPPPKKKATPGSKPAPKPNICSWCYKEIPNYVWDEYEEMCDNCIQDSEGV